MLFCRHSLKILLLLPIVVAACCENASGQNGGIQYSFSDSGFRRFDRPYVLILPGILGEQIWDRNLRKGIKNSQAAVDVEIYDWTHGPLMAGFNIGGNEAKVEHLTQGIIKFKQHQPMRPLFLIGHSGGCRMAISILERLPQEIQVEKSLLLSPCIDANYDIGPATQACRTGLFAFRSPIDIPISMPLTAIHGLANGQLSLSASVVGFRNPSRTTHTNLGTPNFFQIDYTPEMISSGHPGGHFGWTTPGFVKRYITPLLTKQAIPGVSQEQRFR